MYIKAVAGCLLGLGVCAVAGDCQIAPVPLQAELLKQLESKHLSVGATVRAKVTVDWSDTGCELKRGAVLEATVEALEPRKEGTPTTVALAFRRAQCNGKDLTPMSMVVVALAQAPEQVQAVPGVQVSTSSGPYGPGTSSYGQPAVTDIHSPKLQVDTAAHRFPAKAEVRTNDVLNIKGVALKAGEGPGHSSVVTAEKGDLVLRQYTQMLLVPESLMFPPAPPAQPSAPAQTETAPVTPASPPSR